jgi:hypothetical protein
LLKRIVQTLRRFEQWLHHWINKVVYKLGHGRITRVLVFVSVPAALALFALYSWQERVYTPPIFDAQVHYNRDSWNAVSQEAILNTAEELNIPWLLVASTPNAGTWKLYSRDPDRVIPMLVPGFTRDDRNTWFNDQRIQNYIDEELSKRPYRGIGEFFLFDGQVNTPVVRHVVALAMERRLVLHARSDPNAIRQLFELGPSLRILWAHAGMHTQPDVIDSLLYRYPNLWVELSHRVDVAPKGKLDPAWRKLMLRYPDRFLLGSGTYTGQYWYRFREYHGRYRKWLKELPPTVAEQIAYRNGLRLFRISYIEPKKKNAYDF